MNGHIDLGLITPTKYFLTIGVVLGLLFGLIGSSDEGGSFLVNVVRWQLQSVGAIAFLVVSQRWVTRHVASVAKRPWIALCLSGIIGLLLFSPINFLIDVFLENEYQSQDSWFSGWLEELGYLVPPALLAWIAINAPWVLGYKLLPPEPKNSELPEENCPTLSPRE